MPLPTPKAPLVIKSTVSAGKLPKSPALPKVNTATPKLQTFKQGLKAPVNSLPANTTKWLV